MPFVQNPKIIVPENAGYITELILYYCHKGLIHIVSIVSYWCEFVLALFSV